MNRQGRMGIVAVLFVAALATLSAVPPTGYATSVETNLFSDNFDGYLLGSFPSDFVANTWKIVWDGRGENYVTYGPSVSFPQSLQLWGRPNWSAVTQRKFTTEAPVIGYEYHIQMEAIGTGGPGRAEHPGFFSREAATWGRYYATVSFNHDTRRIEAEDGTVLGSWTPRTWYRVKVILDRRRNLYSVWIDGRLAGQNLQTRFADTQSINAMVLMSGHPGVKVWYDDVRVFSVAAAPGPQLQAMLQTNRGCGEGAVLQIGEQMQVLFRVEGTGQAYVRLLNILPADTRTITQQTVSRGQTMIIPGTAGAPAGTRRLRLEVWESAAAFTRGDPATAVDCVFTVTAERPRPELTEYRVRVLRADWEDPTVMVDPPHAEMVILDGSPTGRPGDTLRLAWLPQDQPWPRPAAQHTFRIWVGGVEFWGMAYDAVVRYERDNQPPVASFTFSPTDPNPCQQISFDGRASHDPDGHIVSYAWQFGDGNTSTGAIATHSFAATGTYMVRLTVTDDQGATGFEEKIVRVRTPAPVGDYGDAPDNSCNDAIMAYEGVPGRFPTLFHTTNASTLGYTGPYHRTVNQEWLAHWAVDGPSTTTERDALLVDDDHDDAIVAIFYVEDEDTGQRAYFLQISAIHVAADAPDVPRYINVLVDMNRDGAWQQPGEHLVRDLEVHIPPGRFVFLQSRLFFLSSDAPVWVRVTLTRWPLEIEGWDGSIPPGGLAYGETEDHLVTPGLLVDKPKERLSNFRIWFDPNPVRLQPGIPAIFTLNVERIRDHGPWFEPATSFVLQSLFHAWRIEGTGPYVQVDPLHACLAGRINQPQRMNKIFSIEPMHCVPLPARVNDPPLVLNLQAFFPPGGAGRREVALSRVALDPYGIVVVYDEDPITVEFVEEDEPVNGPVTGSGQTDGEGRFTLALDPKLTLTGQLTECTVRPIPNALFAVGLWPRGETFGLWPRGETFTIEDLRGVTFSVPGYEDLTVTEFTLHMTELEDEATETGDEALQGEIPVLVPFTGLNGQYAVRIDVGVLCLTRDDREVRVRGGTDRDGEFAVALGPTMTISGFLADCRQRSLDLLSNQEFEIYLHPRGESFSLEDLGGFTFYVSGYEPVTVTEEDPTFYRSHAAGVTDYNVDYVCLTRIDRGDD